MPVDYNETVENGHAIPVVLIYLQMGDLVPVSKIIVCIKQGEI